MIETENDLRVHVTHDHLRLLEGRARRLTFLPRQPSNSVLNGRHTSRMRGRGLNFEEIRNYQPGDDVRSIDWKVTARRGEPHVRVFTEERDRPVLLLVDQRMSMFFGSVLNMKSVTAAEVAAVAAHRIVGVGDRVGGIVFSDERMASFRPQRSRRAVNAFLKSISEMNRDLGADRMVEDNGHSLNRPLSAAASMAGQNHLIIVVSDFVGHDRETERLVINMARHNDVILCAVFDPMARELPRNMQMVVGDGRLQVAVDTKRQSTARALQDVVQGRLKTIMGWQTKTGAPVLPLSSGQDTVDQMRHLMGRLQPRGAGRRI